MAALMKVAEESQAPPLTMCAPVGASFAVRRASKMRGAVGDAIGISRPGNSVSTASCIGGTARCSIQKDFR